MKSTAGIHLICLTILAIAKIIEEAFMRYEAAKEGTSKEEEDAAEVVAIVDVVEEDVIITTTNKIILVPPQLLAQRVQ